MSFVPLRDGLTACPDDPARVGIPTELPSGLQTACESVRKEAFIREKYLVIGSTLRVLRLGEGRVKTVANDGSYVELDVGDLWDELTRDAESADLAILLQANLSSITGMSTNAAIQRKAFEYLLSLIEPFAEAHADAMAEKAVQIHLLECGEAA